MNERVGGQDGHEHDGARRRPGADDDGAAPLEGASPSARAGRVSRRGLLGTLGGGAVGAVLGGVAVGLSRGSEAGAEAVSSAAPANAVVEFMGEHQAGIVTPAQDRMHVAAFDVTTSSLDELIGLMKDFSSAIGYMTRGLPIGGSAGAGGDDLLAPPEDTGEAVGLTAGHLTVTVGFGRSLFVDADGKDRFGLKAKLPEGLIELPHFPGDQLEEARSGGDLVVQACADDPQVAVHAIRNLSRIAFGRASVRWSQIGFGRTASTSKAQATPRNLFGFKDGTANVKAEDTSVVDEHVWISGLEGESAWANGGSFMVARRIRMTIETWDRQNLGEQQLVVGRTKASGAPLSGGEEFTEPDFAKKGANGPLIDTNSHVALSHPTRHGGAQMLRRGYNYTDGTDGLGRLDAGLFFIAFVVDPRTHYVPIQNLISKQDLMQEYVRHTGSGLFVIPPGVNEAGGYLGKRLLEG
ncbi:iron uptake transporter deferrochelatase/peroxidase subunit [Galactobacter valiniphilus]|uniref:iron uptake transporter deferrochelatase/peroxidase subunit n=1 Tax=Galactobacter valiniphilus TaxID=2676122 RepID=UPI0038994582